MARRTREHFLALIEILTLGKIRRRRLFMERGPRIFRSASRRAKPALLRLA
jgi:hypothetical protein